MALLGSGVLAIWNGIAPEAEAEFVAWHVREHIPERVGLPGFLRGRRYSAIDGAPAYFNFYETTSPDILSSAGYLARLNDPSPWTRAVVAHFRDTSRTICDVVSSLGAGEGGVVEAIRLGVAGDPAAFTAVMRDQVLPAIQASPGIVGVHLLQGRRDASTGGTAEKALRSQADEIADWILLIEAVDPAAITALRTNAARSAALEAAGAAPDCRRGLYRLQFGLTHAPTGGEPRLW